MTITKVLLHGVICACFGLVIGFLLCIYNDLDFHMKLAKVEIFWIVIVTGVAGCLSKIVKIGLESYFQPQLHVMYQTSSFTRFFITRANILGYRH